MMTALPPHMRCPLTVIGGFLGAGKTTLVNHILATARGRYVVLVNDFGAVNVDASLIVAHEGETLRLTNGCVCCSLNDDFIGTLMRVLDDSALYDHVIIEASGVGDPWAIAEIALVEPQLVLHAVLVLADAERFPTLLADRRIGETVARQIRAADILLLNKADLVDAAAIEAASRLARDVKPGLRVVPTIGGALPDDLLDIRPVTHQPPSRFQAEAVMHEAVFRRYLYRRRGAFDRTLFASVLDRLPTSLLRLKGVFIDAGSGRPTLLQMVRPRWSFAPLAESPGSAWPIELVGIGTADLPSDSELHDWLDGALAQVSLANHALPAI